MENKDYRGQGPLMFRERLSNGTLAPIVDLGDISLASFAPTAEEQKKRESRSGKRAVVKVIETTTDCTMSLTVGNFSIDSLGLHLRSDVTKAEAESKTNFEVCDLTTMQVGDIFRIPFLGIAELEMRDSTAGTPADFVQGLHYEPIAQVAHGYFRLLSKAGVTGKVFADFDVPARKSVKAMSKKKVTGLISFLATNTAEDDEPQIVEAMVTLSAANSFSLINDEFATYEVTGECLYYNGGFFTVDGVVAA